VWEWLIDLSINRFDSAQEVAAAGFYPN